MRYRLEPKTQMLAHLISCSPYVNLDPYRYDRLIESLDRMCDRVRCYRLKFRKDEGFLDLLAGNLSSEEGRSTIRIWQHLLRPLAGHGQISKRHTSGHQRYGIESWRAKPWWCVRTSAEVFVLSEVGARVLELLDGKRKLVAVRDLLLLEYEVDEAQLEQDLNDYINQLKEAGIIHSIGANVMTYDDVVQRAWRNNTLLSVLLELTYACNLNCSFCYNDRSHRGRPLQPGSIPTTDR